MRPRAMDPVLYSKKAYEFSAMIFDEISGNEEIIAYGMKDFLEGENDDIIGRMLKPCKRTLLHSFIENFIKCIFEYYRRKQVWSEFRSLFESVDVDVPDWIPDTEAMEDFDFELPNDRQKDELEVILSISIPKIVPSVFRILFSDRNFLLLFNEKLKECRIEEIGLYDRLKRRKIPKWLEKGILYRDRGICQFCGHDVSGVNNPMVEKHYDHILPLAAGGCNDPTNFQLSCGKCNRAKGKKVLKNPQKLEIYW